MRKMIFFLLFILFLLLIPATLRFSDNLIFNYSLKATQLFEKNQYFKGIKIQRLKFASAKLSSMDTITWQDISSQIIVDNKLFSGAPWVVHIESLDLIFSDIIGKKFILIANGLSARQPPSQEGTLGEHLNRIEKARLRVDFEFDLLRPNTAYSQISDLIKKISTLAHTGKTIVPIKFSGIGSFVIGTELVKAMIKSKQNSEGEYTLVVNKEFFKTIAWLMADKLTDAEAALLSVNLVKVPKLLKIMNTAKKESEKFKADDGIPEDAYRHVLWSYLLAEEYGPVFAKQITDAHEQGDDTNTKAEHRMDYNNNEVGRSYALKQYKRHEILTYLLLDPNVIREAQ